jgi:Flp pilus assembly protein TadB
VDIDEIDSTSRQPESQLGMRTLLARFAIVSALLAVALWMMASYGLNWLSEPFLTPK